MKVEAIRSEEFTTREEMRKVVFEYVEVYYNRERLHSMLGHLSLEQFAQHMAARHRCLFFGGKIKLSMICGGSQK